MKHYICKENSDNKYKVAILIKQTSFINTELLKHYIEPLVTKGIKEDSIICLSLEYNELGKAPAKLKKAYIENLLKSCSSLGVTTLFVADSNYFKTIAGVIKVEPHHGYILPCKIKGYEHINCIISSNYQGLFYNPDLQNKIDMSINTVVNHENNNHIDIGSDIIHYEYYPDKLDSIKQVLNSLHKYPELTCDFEAFSLKHYESGLGTVSFAWDKHNGIAFCIDYEALSKPEEIQIYNPKDKEYKTKLAYGKQVLNQEVRVLLKQFFIEYKGKLIWHNISYDATIAIAQLWMMDITDHVGLIDGLEVMTKNFDCTQVITYLATNSCAGNKLSLKAQSHEYAGAYAQDDIHDIRLINKPELLKYNLTDCLATWYIKEKNYPIMIQDKQEELYLGLMKESLVTIIQMQLTGMPVCMKEVKKAKKELTTISNKHLKAIETFPMVQKAVDILKLKKLNKDFSDRKDKAKNPEKLKPKLIENIDVKFNPASGKHVAVLLHEVIKLPILDKTKTGLPATDEDALKSLLAHAKNYSKIIIQNILDLNKVNKILTTFIPALETAQLGKDGIYYLFGSFKLGGTISGRLSSSNPNLQTIPAGSTYAKIIKRCFKGNAKWLFSGADFSSLEDRINTLLTKDKNKIKVYTDGYDGHCLRAYSYFGDKLPDIINTINSINSIKKKYPEIRQESKAPTFALTYGGTFHTLMKNCGFSKVQAILIEAKYHELYAESDTWVNNKLKQASKDGYVTLAFGLRLRTPMLKQVIWNSKSMPYEASAEGRSAGNAVSGQSYGLLNNRAANEIMLKVRNSPYKYKIKICAQIHDANYFLIENDVDVVKWLNDNLIEAMAYQDLPEIKHDKVKLESNLDLFFPDWSKGIELPNKSSTEEITSICLQSMNQG